MAGLNAKAIRYYEQSGILPRPPRGSNGYRRYTRANVNQVLLFTCMRQLGIPPSSARVLLRRTTAETCSEVRRELLALIAHRVTAIDQEIARLHALRAEIEMYASLLTTSDLPVDDERFADCQDMCCIDPLSSESSSAKESVP
jgi:DNA-binding transcriptional MerR regulator